MIKSKKMRLTEQVALMGWKSNAYWVLIDLDIDGKITLKWVLQKQDRVK
jgi:hypothetical protein